MTPEEKAIAADVIAQAWDDGFEHCRAAAILLCTAHGRHDLATQIAQIPLHKLEPEARSERSTR
jgi:hypothetical protein